MPETTPAVDTSAPITEAWLRAVGFKWHQLDRQPTRQWLLWLDRNTEDLGLELAYAGDHFRDWFCWLRADTAGRYHRFIHVRHVRTIGEVIALVEALSGQDWDPRNHIGGSLRTPEAADRWRAEGERLDRQFLRTATPWHAIERDDSRGGALPEHLQSHADVSADREST